MPEKSQQTCGTARLTITATLIQDSTQTLTLSHRLNNQHICNVLWIIFGSMIIWRRLYFETKGNLIARVYKSKVKFHEEPEWSREKQANCQKGEKTRVTKSPLILVFDEIWLRVKIPDQSKSEVEQKHCGSGWSLTLSWK